MNLSQLKYIVEVERCGSITKAAQSLYMGQPNLSKAIKELENEIGVPIFRRGAKGVEPTEKGRELLVYAKSVLAQVKKMESVSESTDTGKASFSLVMPGAEYISYAFTLFLRELGSAERLDVRLAEADPLTGLDHVADCDHSLGIIRFPVSCEEHFLSCIEDRGLKARELWTYDLVAVASRKSVLSSEYEVTEKDLADGIEVWSEDLFPALPGSAAPALGRRRICAKDRGTQADILSAEPNAFLLTTPVPREFLRRCSLMQKPCVSPRLTFRDVLLCHGSYRFTETDKQFLDILDEVRRSIIV